MRRYQFARGASFEDWTPDGRITISTRFGNTNQLHVVDVPMGARRQLTFFDEPVNSGSWSPTGARKGVAYVRDAGGDENYQLEYLDPAAADPVRLTDGRGRAGTGAWSPDGTGTRSIGPRGPASSRTSTSTTHSTARAPELVFEAPEVGWNAVDWSPDGKSLLLIHFVSVNESYLWTYDLATREKREIEPAKVKAARGGYFSRDGKGVYITSDLGSEFRTLRYVDLASGKVTPLTDHLKWEVEDFGLSKDGRYLAYVANEDGASRLGVMDLVQKADLISPDCRSGSSARSASTGRASASPSTWRRRTPRPTSGSGRSRTASSSAGRRARSGRSTRSRSSSRRSCITRRSTRWMARRARSRPGCTSRRARVRTRC